ncbi:MAG: MerR family DNA-binding transcriptional regulator [Pseudomonadota bacterium]
MPKVAILPEILPADGDRFTIADLAREFDVTPRTIRFYESEGLIAPHREGQQRVYSRRDRARLGWILRGKRVGFSLADIRELMDMYETAGPAPQRRALIEKCRIRIDTLERQRADIDDTISEIQAFVDAVDTSSAMSAAN